MTPESSPPPSDQPTPPAKTMFFAAMGAGLLPCLGAPVPWIFFFVNRAEKNQSAEQQKWTKRILAIAIVDVLVVFSVLFLVAHRKEIVGTKPWTPKSMIGITVEEPALKEGLKVSIVSAGSPAEAANIAVGDVVDTCEGNSVRSRVQLYKCVGNHAPNDQVKLGVHRGELTRELTVVTQSPERVMSAAKPGVEAPRCQPMELPGTAQLIGLGLFLALGVFVLVRGGGPSVLALALPIPVISLANHFITQQLCIHTQLTNGAIALFELPMSPLSLLLIAVLVDRFAMRNEAPKVNSGDRGWFRTGLLAIWIHVTGVVRLGLILSAIIIAAHASIQTTPVEDWIAEGAQSPFIKVLVFLTAVVLAPLGEERFFRGVFLEGLIRVMKPWLAVVSVAIVFALLHGGYGIKAAVVVWLACVLGWARLQSRGLKAPILLHAAQNAVVGLLFLLR